MRRAGRARCSGWSSKARAARLQYRKSPARQQKREPYSLFCLHAGGVDDLGPFRDLVLQELAGVLGRVADRLDADLVEALLDLRLVDRLARLGREPVHDLARRAG